MPLLATTVSIPSSRTVAQLVTESPRRADLRGFLSSVGSMDVLGVAGKVRQPPQPPITECGPSTSGLLVRRYREHVTDIIPRFFHAQATRNCGESIFLWENRIYYRVDGLMIYLALCRLQRLPLSESLGSMRHSEPMSLLEPYDSSRGQEGSVYEAWLPPPGNKVFWVKPSAPRPCRPDCLGVRPTGTTPSTPVTVTILGSSHVLVGVLEPLLSRQTLKFLPRNPELILRGLCRGPSEKHFFDMQG